MSDEKSKENGKGEGQKESPKKDEAKKKEEPKKDAPASAPAAPKAAPAPAPTHPPAHGPAHWPAMPPTSYIFPHPPVHGYGHGHSAQQSSHRSESLTFAGAGLVASLTLLTVQLVLSIALGKTDPRALCCSTCLVLSFLWAVGSYGRNTSGCGDQSFLAKVIRAVRAALVALEAFYLSLPPDDPKPASCAPPYFLATPCWPPPPPETPAAAPAPAAEKPKPAPKEDKKPPAGSSKLDGAVQTGPTPEDEAKKKEEEDKKKEEEAKKKAEEEAKKKKEEEEAKKKKEEEDRKRCEELELSLLVKKYLDIINGPACPLPGPIPAPAPAPAPEAPKPADDNKEKPPKKEEGEKKPAEPKKPDPPKFFKPKPPPGQPKSCYRDGRARARTWFSRDAACWGTEECKCGCQK
ncbi:unnamed protein product [Parajaminaea phylloscopi]